MTDEWIKSGIYLHAVEYCMCAKSLQWCLTLCDPMDCSPQAPQIEPGSPVLQADSLPSELPGKTKELPNEGRAESRLP